MTNSTLVVRSLRYHWRTHASVLLGATLSTAILVGALAVGDSVRYSLRSIAVSRLGNIELALNGQSHFFREELADELIPDLKTPVAPVILLRGMAAGEGGEIRVGRVQVVGVTERFWKMGGEPSSALSRDSQSTGDAVILNHRLASRLRVHPGDDILLRIDKPSLLSRDAPLSDTRDATIALRLRVASVEPDTGFGRFSLEANQVPPSNAFISMELLQRKLNLKSRVNALLVGARVDGRGSRRPPTPAQASAILRQCWELPDAGLELRELRGGSLLELRTKRIFLDPPVAKAFMEASPRVQGVLTYFVNEILARGHSTPYSTVSALQGGVVPPDMKDDEILVNEWLARDLEVRTGDQVVLKYFVVGPMRQLNEKSQSLRVRAVLPMRGTALDRDLMPEIPGLTDKKNCRDWEPGIPIHLERIRDKDEEYWKLYRGTPKAFVTLRAGQRMWTNRFGNLTAIRYPMSAQERRSMLIHRGPHGYFTFDDRARQSLDPASVGLFFVPVREQALAASSQSMDFGQLFLGFSSFLIIAALLLMAMLFAFGVEQRAEEIGTLLAVGFNPKKVQKLLLMEGGAIAGIAALMGSMSGIFYTRAVIRALTTVWSDAVADSALQYHAELTTLVGGAAAGFFIASFSIWLVLRKQAQSPARELLASGAESETRLFGSDRSSSKRRIPGIPTAVITFIGAVALTVIAFLSSRGHGAEIFFGAGTLLLLSGMAACRAWMALMERGASSDHLTIPSLGFRNTIRRRGRSLTTVGLLACGSFLIIAIGANRHDPHEDATLRSSGTGGFAYYAESTLPIYHDLNRQDGREEFGLDDDALRGVEVVPLRMREGDEASCLNLNRAQVPRLLGIKPDAFAKRNAFAFVKGGGGGGWNLLDRTKQQDVIPAIGDQNTVVWSLGKSIGDTLAYVDDRGNRFRLRIVGIVANSILQGALLISERSFVERFPLHNGYQVFLIDAQREQAAKAAAELTRGLEDVGFSALPAPDRLLEFNAVENTYLTIFAILGGLGLLLGSVGLGVVVLRNVLERRGELALLRAVGFRSRALHWLVFSEHSFLLMIGLLVGIVSAVVAVLPSLQSPGASVPYQSLTITLVAVFASGFLWTWGATALALRGSLMDALRNE